jgi:S-adenosylhomocysteine hydrolase
MAKQDYDVKDITLAPEGKLKIEWAGKQKQVAQKLWQPHQTHFQHKIA